MSPLYNEEIYEEGDETEDALVKFNMTFQSLNEYLNNIIRVIN